MRMREPLKSPVREIRTPGSVRGPLGNRRSYRDDIGVNERVELLKRPVPRSDPRREPPVTTEFMAVLGRDPSH